MLETPRGAPPLRDQAQPLAFPEPFSSKDHSPSRWEKFISRPGTPRAQDTVSTHSPAGQNEEPSPPDLAPSAETGDNKEAPPETRCEPLALQHTDQSLESFHLHISGSHDHFTASPPPNPHRTLFAETHSSLWERRAGKEGMTCSRIYSISPILQTGPGR